MTLSVGHQVKAEALQSLLTVKGKLGEGGQGAVYLVEGPHGRYALKWYNPEQATSEQQKALRDLIQAGPPRGPAGRRFIWPLDLVTASQMTLFGYLMPLIDTERFVTLGEVQARLKPRASYPTLCEISSQIANSYRVLHLNGYCYRDISAGNLMFDPTTGDVFICDNDNVGINRQSQCQVHGTMEYMAPEVVCGEADPSTDTDLHSLAVLLFNLWVWHHPMHGNLEYNIRSWDLVSKRYVYGERPVFIFDPNDSSNHLPNDPDYESVRRLWKTCPNQLQSLFERAFTVGLKDPSQRITEGEWQRLFWQLKDTAISCLNCRAANLWERGASEPTCWHCRQTIPLPPKLICRHASGTHTVLLTREATLLERHLNAAPTDEQATIVLGQVVQNPNNPEVFGIRNLTESSWSATYADGTMREVPPQRAAPITYGLKLNIAGRVAEITA